MAEPLPRMRCQSCSTWYYVKDLAAIKVRYLRGPVQVCRPCMREAVKNIKGRGGPIPQR